VLACRGWRAFCTAGGLQEEKSVLLWENFVARELVSEVVVIAGAAWVAD